MEPKFSVVIIAKNEAKTLPRLGASLKEFLSNGGEWIVVDTNSSDNTVEVAKSLGAKVYAVDNKFRKVISVEEAKAINARFIVEGEAPIVAEGHTLFDFTSARNYAAGLAKNDFIWMPDADEAFTKYNLEAINETIKNCDRLEYEFIFSHDPVGNPAIRFMHSKAYNRTKFKWTGCVHEVLAGEGKTTYLPQDKVLLEHWQNHETNRSGYLPGLALDCFLNPDNDRNSHYLGREMLWAGRTKSAIKELERHIAMNRWPTEKGQSLIFIGRAYEILGENDKAIEHWLKAYNCDPKRRAALMELANFYFRHGDAFLTNVYTTAALEVPEAHFYADDHAMFRHQPHDFLAWAKWYLGDKEGAKKHYLKAAEYQVTDKTLFDWRFHYRCPKVSIVIPTLGRPEKLARCLKGIKENANYEPYEVIVVHDGEEMAPIDYLGATVLKNETRIGVPKTLARGVEASTGELVMFLANDIIPQKNFLIQAVKKMNETYGEQMDGLVGLNDCYWHGEFPTHFLASKKLL
jgi:glycosyltransferase involved in cell wall biosynthesis